MKNKFMNSQKRHERNVRDFNEKAERKLEEEALRNRTNPPKQPKRV